MNRIMSVVVVASMAFVLLALAIPAIGRWRMQAERARCQDNLRRVAGFALRDYAEKTGAFPSGTVLVPNLAPDKRLSWVVPILLRLGRDEVDRQIDRTAAWDVLPNRSSTQFVISQLICPSADAPPTTIDAGWLHYLGMAGAGADAPSLDLDHPRAGIFRYTTATPVAAVKDGLANVLLVVESGTEIGLWGQGGPTSIRPVDPAKSPQLGSGRPFGGNHPGGANMAFADGSFRFVTDRIQSKVLEMLAAMADGQNEIGPPD